MPAVTTPESAARVLGGHAEEKFLTSFFVFYKTSRILEQNNTVFKNQSDHFFEQLQIQGKETGDVTLKTISGRYFVNDRMVRFDDKGQSGASSVVSEWSTLGVGGVTFKAGI